MSFIEICVAHASILTILAISFERFYAICRPLEAGYTCTKRRAVVIIAFIWLAAIVSCLPMLSITELTMAEYIDGSTVPVCSNSLQTGWHPLYYVAIFLLFFVIPFGVLLVLYCLISRKLTSDSKSISGNQGSTNSKRRYQVRRQVVLMLASVCVTFFVCLLPFRLLTLWIIISDQEDIAQIGVETYYVLLFVCRLLLYVNSSINPILYNLISCKFRAAFCRILKMNWQRHVSSRPDSCVTDRMSTIERPGNATMMSGGHSQASRTASYVSQSGCHCEHCLSVSSNGICKNNAGKMSSPETILSGNRAIVENNSLSSLPTNGATRTTTRKGLLHPKSHYIQTLIYIEQPKRLFPKILHQRSGSLVVQNKGCHVKNGHLSLGQTSSVHLRFPVESVLLKERTKSVIIPHEHQDLPSQNNDMKHEPIVYMKSDVPHLAVVVAEEKARSVYHSHVTSLPRAQTENSLSCCQEYVVSSLSAREHSCLEIANVDSQHKENNFWSKEPRPVNHKSMSSQSHDSNPSGELMIRDRNDKVTPEIKKYCVKDVKSTERM